MMLDPAASRVQHAINMIGNLAVFLAVRCGSWAHTPYLTMAPDCRCLVLAFVALLLPRQGADAFLQPRPVLPGSRKSTSIMSKQTIMSAAVERRDFVTQLSRGVIGALGVGIATDRATAYEQEYLKEPTPEFKAMEARQTAFAAAQRAYKLEFVKQLDTFLAVTTDDEAVKALNTMSATVVQRGGLPESIRINDLLKTCRRKKGEMKDSGKWGTPVQIAYETLVQTTNRAVIPMQSGA